MHSQTHNVAREYVIKGHTLARTNPPPHPTPIKPFSFLQLIIRQGFTLHWNHNCVQSHCDLIFDRLTQKSVEVFCWPCTSNISTSIDNHMSVHSLLSNWTRKCLLTNQQIAVASMSFLLKGFGHNNMPVLPLFSEYCTTLLGLIYNSTNF